MPQTDEISTGEISRNLSAMAETIGRIEGKLDQRPAWADINRLEAARDKVEALQDEAIKQLQDNGRWLVRACAGSLIAAIAAAGTAVLGR